MNNEIIKFNNGNLELDVTVTPDKDAVWLTANQWHYCLIVMKKQFVSILITRLKIMKLKKRTTRKKCVLLELNNLFRFIF